MTYNMDEYYERIDDYELLCQPHSVCDLPFWREVVRRYEPKLVLEMACGSGRIGIDLLHTPQSFHLEGLDINEQMLAAYREKLKRELEAVKLRVSLHLADMCQFELQKKGQFDLIFLPFDSLGHLYETRQQIGAFRTAYEHLAPGGRFVVDVYLPMDAPRDPSSQICLDMVVKAPDGAYTIASYSSCRYDRHKQIDHYTFIREKFFAAGASERYLTQVDVRTFSPGELQLLFQISGFDIEQMYGGYEWQPFEYGGRQIIVGRKPHS